jgi:hypothetical protein
MLQHSLDERVQTKVQALKESAAAKMVNLIHSSMGMSLRSTLDATSHLRCTDPRDKVYAVLNTVSSGHKDIEADYTKPLPDLVNLVLRNMHDIEEPHSAFMIDTQSSSLETVFGMPPGAICATEKNDYVPPSSPLMRLYEVTCDGTEMIPGNGAELVLEEIYIWCKRYEHRTIAHVVSNDLDNFRKSLADWYAFFRRQERIERIADRRQRLSKSARHFGMDDYPRTNLGVRKCEKLLEGIPKTGWKTFKDCCEKCSRLLESL